MANPSRNAPCPCGRLAKYKRCCQGKVDWQKLISAEESMQARHMTIRGKNLLFLRLLSKDLKLDLLDQKLPWQDVKQAVTPEKVESIHRRIIQIWPSGADLQTAMAAETGTSSGLYIGHYHLPSLSRGITRHCLYADKILLVDPFTYAQNINDKFNPLINPNTYISNTLYCLHIWHKLSPWIQKGLVSFVRVPGDFDPNLTIACNKIQEVRFRNPELSRILDETSRREVEHGEFAVQEGILKMLNRPKEELEASLHEHFPNISQPEIDQFFRECHSNALKNPYFVESNAKQMSILNTGANYEMAKRTASLSGSHLITDIDCRWKEIELDRVENQVQDENWEPFAKAIQAAQLKCLNNVDLQMALRLRTENRLENMRMFFRRIWRQSQTSNLYASEKAVELAAELNHHVREAEAEWECIGSELLKWFAERLTPTTIAASFADWRAGAVVAMSGAIMRGAAAVKDYRNLPTKMPAAFFLKCRH